MRRIEFKTRAFSVKLPESFHRQLRDYLWFEKARTGVSLPKQVQKMLAEYMKNHPLGEEK